MHVEANLFGPDVMIIIGIIVVIFGGSKIPELARGLGQGIKEFKTAVSEEPKPEETPKVATAATAATTAPEPAAPVAPAVAPSEPVAGGAPADRP